MEIRFVVIHVLMWCIIYLKVSKKGFYLRQRCLELRREVNYGLRFFINKVSFFLPSHDLLLWTDLKTLEMKGLIKSIQTARHI